MRSEAEFLEILATLEHQDMQDPARRAARTAAVEPNMDIHVDGRRRPAASVDDDNVFVADSKRFFCSNFDPDVWSEAERAVFARRYALYPKQFGRIAAGLPDKTTPQCVSYYYLHKHIPGYDFKALSRERRERRKKPKGRPKKAKGSALLADIATSKATEKEAQEEANKHHEDSPGSPSPPEQVEPAASERDLAAAEALEALAGASRPEPKKSRSRGSHWNAHEKAEFWRFLPVYGRDWAALSAALPSKSSAQARNFFARHASESPFFHEATAHAEEVADLPLEERMARGAQFLAAWTQETPGATPMRAKESVAQPPTPAPAALPPASAPQSTPSTQATPAPYPSLPVPGPGQIPPPTTPTPMPYAAYHAYTPASAPAPAAPASAFAPEYAPAPARRTSRHSDDDETDEDSAPESAPQWTYGAQYAPQPGMYYARERMPVRYGPPGVPYRGMPYTPGSARQYAPGTPYGYGYAAPAYDGMRRVPMPMRPAMGYFQLPSENSNPPQ